MLAVIITITKTLRAPVPQVCAQARRLQGLVPHAVARAAELQSSYERSVADEFQGGISVASTVGALTRARGPIRLSGGRVRSVVT